MNRAILRIAIPSIVSSFTVPLLGLVDLFLAGHIGGAEYIGAISVGTTIFNMLYWLLYFLRVSTGGFTAQAEGRGDTAEETRVLVRSLTVAAALGLGFIILQKPLSHCAFAIIGATPEVEQLAKKYFDILIYGAPAVFALYGFTGWFIGKQNAKAPMLVAILQNVVNIFLSTLLVFGFNLKTEGLAIGTLAAQYAGVAVSALIWYRAYRSAARREHLQGLWAKGTLGRFFRVNGDFFLRTLCMIAVQVGFTAMGARQGDLVLAANALLLQTYSIFSYFLDGFAFAGEAMGGKFYGAGNRADFRRLTRQLFLWGVGIALTFTLAFALLYRPFLGLLTDEADVIAAAGAYLPYAIAIPLVGFATFVFDGLYIGATASRLMLLSVFSGAVVFLILSQTLQPTLGNHALWIGMLAFLAVRSIVQALTYREILPKG